MQERLQHLLEGIPPEAGRDVLKRVGDGQVDSESNERWTGRPRNKRSDRDGASQSKWEIIQEKVERIINRTAICPLEGIASEPDFLHDSMLNDPLNSQRVYAAIDLWSQKINNFTLRQFHDWYYSVAAPTNLIFSRSKNYFPLFDDSVKAVDDLLKFQFGDDDGEISQFLTELVNVIDRQPIREGQEDVNLKANTFLIHAPPSAGKNFFMDMVLTLLLNNGQFGTANRHNQFAFQDAVSKRIILWNEPNYESALTDYLKTLFEGGDTKVRVKNKPDIHIKRTPIIVLTNNVVPFMSDKAFKDRIVQYKWVTAPMLKEHMYKPHPLAFFSLLNKYKIKY